MEFINHVADHYRSRAEHCPRDWELCHDGWFYEPSVAEHAFATMVEQQPNITLVLRAQLTGVEKSDRRIASAMSIEEGVVLKSLDVEALQRRLDNAGVPH